MIAAEKVGVVLLAAGLSRRFGTDDKLAQPYRGRPLIAHAAGMLAQVPFGAHVAVVHGEAAGLLPACFAHVHNPDPAGGLSGSVRLGVAAVAARGLPACLIALADMPHITLAHIAALLRAFPAGDPMAILGTARGVEAMVPALFGSGRYGELLALSGDRGARELLRGAPAMACDPAILADFDRPEDFGR
jgi:molybdenum cofactor cytidylyltransferase